MRKVQTVEIVGRFVKTTHPYTGVTEDHIFEDARTAELHGRPVLEALSWLGTPFRDCADVKGPNGGVDCAMLLVRSFVDTGIVPPLDPRPYSPQWHMSHSYERFIGWIEECGGVRVDQPRLGDVVLYQYGKCFSHGGIIINSTEIVHAYAKSDVCHTSRQDETDLMFLRSGLPRPRLYFEVAR